MASSLAEPIILRCRTGHGLPVRGNSQPVICQVSELLASHPDLNLALGLLFGDARAILDHGAELNLVLDRRQVKVRHKAPSLLGILHVSLLARERVGALAALESEHDDSPGERAAEGRANSREVLVSRRTVLNRSQVLYLVTIESYASN